MHIFYCAGGNFGEVAGVFLRRKHSPDALRGGTGRWPLASGVLSGATDCTGRTGESPVLSVRCEGVLATLSAHESGGARPVCERFATLSAYGSGEHRTLRVRPVACVR